MTLVRVTLRLEGPLGTSLTSGTLFGHLCWAYRACHGDEALGRWLRAMAAGDEPPCLVSDGLPHGLLPRPLMPRSHAELPPAEADLAKLRRRRGWVRRTEWLGVRERLSPVAVEPILVDWRVDPQRQAHNRIDRQTGTTPESAGLWFADDDWSFHAEPLRDVYVATTLDQDELATLFTEVGSQGYGRDATYGRGRWTVAEVAGDTALEALEGNRLLSLSHGCWSPGMAEARWERWTHFGKVGIELAMTGARPFKRPILLMRPGATWRPKGPGPFGRLLDHVHQDRPEVVHNAWHLAIPYTEAGA